MGFFDRFRKKKEEQSEKGQERNAKTADLPQSSDSTASKSGDGEASWDDESLSFSMSKGSVLEESVLQEERSTPVKEDPDTISNEQIIKNDTVLDTYIVESDAIKGGMGSVWKVHHKGWNTDLAMKRPQPRFFAEGSEERKKNFVRECESWINLGLHPNIVSCYYVRDISGVPTIFSEWMENGSLKNRIDDGSLYEGTNEEVQERLLDIAIQFAEGLHYAHESEGHLIHQDVKPDNLLLTKDWQAKVADFGLARARTQMLSGSLEISGDGSGNEPESESSAGATHLAPTGGYTPAYCSFEQIAGKTLSRRTDIYSCAVSVLEMYLGKRPWKRGTQAGTNCAEYFAQCRIAIPESLKILTAQCLAEDPEKRPHDFAQVIDTLKKTYKDIFGIPYPREDSKAAANTADSLNNMALSYLDLGKVKEAGEYWDEALKQSPDHLCSVYNQGLFEWREGKIPYDELIRRCSAADASRDETGLAGRWKEELETEQQDVSARSVVLGWWQAGDYFHGEKISDRGKFRQNAYTFARISPDGRKIYGAIADAVGCWDAETLEELYFVREAREPANDFINAFLLTPDGRYLVGQSGYRTVWAADTADGKIVRFLRRDASAPKPAVSQPGKPLTKEEMMKAMMALSAAPVGIASVCLYPDGRHVCILLEDMTLHSYDLETGTEIRAIPAKNHMLKGRTEQLCFSPDGETLYIGTALGALGVLDMKTGRFRTVLTHPSGKSFSAMCMSKDSAWLYSCIGGAICRYRTDTLECERIELSWPCTGPIWVSEDGIRLLSTGSGNIVRLWDLRSGQMIRAFAGHKEYLRTLEATEDLSLIVSGGWDKTLQIWDGAKEVRRAEWELNQAKSYVVRITVQNETEEREDAIREKVGRKDYTQALVLLKDAEVKFEPYRFLPLRRELMKVCRCGALEEVTEAGHFSVETPRGLWADPRGGFFATISVGRTEQLLATYDEKGQKHLSIPLPDGHNWSELYSMDTLCYSASGRFLAAGNMPVILWSEERDETILIQIENEKSSITQMTFSPDERWLFILLGSTLYFVSTTDGTVRRKAYLNSIDGSGTPVPDGFCLLPSGDAAVIFNSEGDLVLYRFRNDLILERRIEAVRGDENGNNYVHDILLSPDGSMLYVCSWLGVSVWNTESWEKADHYPAEEINPTKEYLHNNIILSPDGAYFAILSDKVRIWSVAEKKMVWEIPGIMPEAAAFAPDTSALYVADKNSIHVFVLRRELSS